MSISHGDTGGPQKPSNLITLLRDTNRDGQVDERHDLLTGLNSPFGVAWADDTLYVAATDAILAYPYKLGENKITAQPRVLTPLPGGPIDHHWTKDLALSLTAASSMSAWAPTPTCGKRYRGREGRAAVWEVDRQTGAARVYASGFAIRTASASTRIRAHSGPSSTSATNWGPTSCRLHDLGEGWRLLRLAVELLRQPCGCPRASAAPGYGGKSYPCRLRAFSHVAALGLTFTHGSALPAPYTNGAFIGEHGSWNATISTATRWSSCPSRTASPMARLRMW